MNLTADVGDVCYTCDELIDANEKLTDRVNVLEDKVKGIQKENNDLRAYVNVITTELNNVIELLNQRYNVN